MASGYSALACTATSCQPLGAAETHARAELQAGSALRAGKEHSAPCPHQHLHLHLLLLCGLSTLPLLFRTHPLSFEAPPCAFWAFSLAAEDTVSRQGQSHLGLGLGPEVQVWQGLGSKGKLQGTWWPWECVLAPCPCAWHPRVPRSGSTGPPPGRGCSPVPSPTGLCCVQSPHSLTLSGLVSPQAQGRDFPWCVFRSPSGTLFSAYLWNILVLPFCLLVGSLWPVVEEVVGSISPCGPLIPPGSATCPGALWKASRSAWPWRSGLHFLSKVPK